MRVQKLADDVSLFGAIGLSDQPINQLGLLESIGLPRSEAGYQRDVGRNDARNQAVRDVPDKNEHLLLMALRIDKPRDDEKALP